MSSSLNLFSSYSTCSKHSTLKLPDGTGHLITHIGTVTLSPTLCLKNVLFVPTFQFNLISISELVKTRTFFVFFSNDECVFQDMLSKKKIGLGRLHEGLYHLHNPAIIFSFQNSAQNNLWHCRLGHASPSCLQLLAKQFSFIHSSNNVNCMICPQAKQTHLCFVNSSIKTSRPFQMIHCDI